MHFQKSDAYECFVLVFSIVLTSIINYSTPVLGINDKDTKDDWKDSNVSSPHECNRICKKGETKTCYFHFTVEVYTTLGGACSLCTPNENNTGSCQCVLGDGYEKGILTVNRQIPGPSIQVCAGDTVIIDVTNNMHGFELSIHWHGILQKGTQYYDGVPRLTQCAIRQGATFRYHMLAVPGTHWWHSHAGLQKGDGLYGSFIVRECPEDDPHFKLYDCDTHVMVIADYYHPLVMEKYPGQFFNNSNQDVDNILIDGKGQYTDRLTGGTTNSPFAVFKVKKGKKYRFRLVNAFAATCQAQLTIEGHSLTAIATDGQPFKPVVVDTIISVSGERFDFVVKADQPIGAYWIQVKGLGSTDCLRTQPQQLAILQYESGPTQPSTPAPTLETGQSTGVVLNPLDGICPGPGLGNICINQLKNAKEVPKDILKEVPDVKLFFLQSFYPYTPMQAFQPGKYRNIMIANFAVSISTMNGISFESAPAPPLSQIKDIPPETFCNAVNGYPKNCGIPCICTHKVDIPLNAIAEITVCDGAFVPLLSHAFHLHGYVFYVMNQGLISEMSPGLNFKNMSMKDIADLDGLFPSQFDAPPGKDTLQLTNFGCIKFRFKADNPGWWFFHCHFLFHLTTGMAVVVHVGEKSDLPPVPKDFPQCGDYLPPYKEKDNW